MKKESTSYPDIIDVRTMCDILHIGRQKAYRLLRTNTVYSKRIGNTYRIPLSSLHDYIFDNHAE